jgi:hypothetical protein
LVTLPLKLNSTPRMRRLPMNSMVLSGPVTRALSVSVWKAASVTESCSSNKAALAPTS